MSNENKKPTISERVELLKGNCKLSVIKYDNGNGAIFFTKGDKTLKKNLSLFAFGYTLECIGDVIAKMLTQIGGLEALFNSINGNIIEIPAKGGNKQ